MLRKKPAESWEASVSWVAVDRASNWIYIQVYLGICAKMLTRLETIWALGELFSLGRFLLIDGDRQFHAGLIMSG
jgi:hypothetical protein